MRQVAWPTFAAALVLSGMAAVAAEPASKRTPCQEFERFATNHKFSLTEGIVVVKDGVTQYEYYDPHYGPDQPHALWSATKTITGALLGIAVRDGKVSLDQSLAQYYPRRDFDANYERIRLNDLFYMDTGFVWDEYYAGDVTKSPVLMMLFGPDRDDMAGFAAHAPVIAQGPGYQWNYSTGTSTVIMGVLKSAYGEAYSRMPWNALFDPLGLKGVAFERDGAGTFAGGSYGFATPRDMAKLGQLILGRGRWNGEALLPEEWIEKMETPSPGYLAPGTVITDFTDGVYGGALWLNRAAGPRKTKPHPSSPEDMVYAIGHHGQLIVVLPSQNMVIARTGYDEIYSNKIDAFVSRALACFAGSGGPLGQVMPMPPSVRPSFARTFKTVTSALKQNMVQATVAKWVCSCTFVSKVDMKTCIERSNIPLASVLTRVRKFRSGRKGISVGYSWLGQILAGHRKTVRAEFDEQHPEFGCRLLPDAPDQSQATATTP